jgi:DNA-binding MarR family transcriptional regulator
MQGNSLRFRTMPPDSRLDPISEARRQWVQRDLGEPVAMTAATSIVRAQQIVLTSIDRALRPLGLTFARYEVLMLLSFTRRGELPMTKIGTRLMVHPTGITKLVDRLERDGLVVRIPNPADRRGTLARLTPEGKKLAGRATRVVRKMRFGVDLDDTKLETIVGLLNDLRQAAGDL